jgi:hypothetical protein
MQLAVWVKSLTNVSRLSLLPCNRENVMPSENRWQHGGDAPSLQMRYVYSMQQPWTDDLIREAQ